MESIELKLWAERLRLALVELVDSAKSGHLGGSLSISDVLAVLYAETMRVRVDEPQWEKRDRLVLSKGHCTPALYSALAIKGFLNADDLAGYRKAEGHLSGHAEMREVAGVDMSTGSLGQGLSAAVGMAIAGRLKDDDFHTFCILGDGELGEGQIWEAARTAAHFGLDSLIAIVDFNHLQIDGTVEEVSGIGEIDSKFRSFGWNVINIDGHDIPSIRKAFVDAFSYRSAPTCIIANTVKGKGVSFMENDVKWHGSTPSDEQFMRAKTEISNRIEEMEKMQ
ncbi:transketolase [Actinomyces sp. B33]|uniref:transketolase n=1 Tax=Actinomyces sp. B33 TaxID=2942131 RepID=UPI00233FB388|nr:transketolase [Actinomyces sp. B33]MDC4232506.1 transketolase [Actinomyces sp. B33]